jgi:hypothetical protein
LDNKKPPPQSIVAIRTAKELPLRLGVLIDTSGSESVSGPIERVSILFGHQSVRVTERHYAPRVRSRQEQLEAE